MKTPSQYYSIINIVKGSVIHKGKMNKPRKNYGLVKIQDMYYAVCGQIRHSTSEESIDVYNHKSDKW